MSTNYYVKRNPCARCGRSDEAIHLGKTSVGWTFSFQGSATVRDFESWSQLVRSADVIEDEYGTPLTADDMIELARTWGKPNGKVHNRLYPSPHNWEDSAGHSFTAFDFS